MILYSAPASPFGRMVKLTAWCLGQVDDLEVRATNTGDPDDGIRAVNPLGAHTKRVEILATGERNPGGWKRTSTGRGSGILGGKPRQTL